MNVLQGLFRIADEGLRPAGARLVELVAFASAVEVGP